MLKEIMIENNSGISDPITLNFEKGKYEFKSQNIFQEKVVNPAILYGKNASGKSSVLRTFENLINIFTADLTKTNYIYGMKNVFYDKEETTISVIIELEQKRFDYTIKIKDYTIIIDEILKVDGNEYKIRKEFDGLDNNLSIIRYIGQEKTDENITQIYKYFQRISFVSTENFVQLSHPISFNKMLLTHNEKIKEIVEKFGDIMNLTFEIEKTSSGEILYAWYEGKRLDYKKMISSGTRDFYEMIAIIFEMKENSLLVIDEIEKTFHPDLLTKLIDFVVGEYKIQIIASSHNTNFMKNMRPDQLFITKKENNKVTIEKLSEKYPNIKEIHNIEKLYMGGKFE